MTGWTDRPTEDDAGIDDLLLDEQGQHVDSETGDDDSRFPAQARRAYITLLNSRFISRARHRVAWEGLISWELEIRQRLSELYLDLEIDHDAEVAFKRQQDRDDVPRLLRRDRPLSRDASFVLLFLRREYAFVDAANGPVVVTTEQIGEFLRAFKQDGDLNDARFTRRVNAAIAALVKPLQLLTPDPAADYMFTVSPVVTSLIGSEEIQALEAAFRAEAQSARGENEPGSEDPEDNDNDQTDENADIEEEL